jgi:hypothetical protein
MAGVILPFARDDIVSIGGCRILCVYDDEVAGKMALVRYERLVELAAALRRGDMGQATLLSAHFAVHYEDIMAFTPGPAHQMHWRR